MNFLFVHNNFPGQFRHIAAHLARNPRHKVAAIGSETAQNIDGVRLQRYTLDLRHVGQTHPFARFYDIECRRAEQTLYAAISLATSGFHPDVMVVHCGWGENLPLRPVWPNARMIVYCEFYYRPSGQDVNFDPEFGALSLDGMTALNARNANSLLALVDCDDGVSPTLWQRSTYPKILQSKIHVIHEGIDSNVVRPDPDATFQLPSGRILRRGDPVLTFVARNLEPLRGYHIFMRALPRIMAACRDADILIVGADGVSYGPRPKSLTWKEIFYKEVASRLDMSRVHFLGHLPYPSYLRLLQISRAHVYFTYPFVLSWSLTESMSAGCTIIASDTAPVQEVLDEHSAILVPFLDSYGLSEAAIDVLRRPGVHAKLGQKARDTIVSEFDLATRIIPKLEAFLSS